MISDQDMREWLLNYILFYKWGNLQMGKGELIWSIVLYPIAAPTCLIIIGLSLILRLRG